MSDLAGKVVEHVAALLVDAEEPGCSVEARSLQVLEDRGDAIAVRAATA